MIVVVEKNDIDRQEPPTVIKIGVTRSGANAIARMAKKYGMQKQEIGGRVYDWFMAQDSIVQRAVLGLLEGLEVDAATRFMERLAEQAKKPPTGSGGRIKPRKARLSGGEVQFEE